MFTDRFIKVPVDLYDTSKAAMIGYTNETNEGQSYCMINPFEISFYRPAADDNGAISQTVIHFKSGESFCCVLSIKEFQKLLNLHNV